MIGTDEQLAVEPGCIEDDQARQLRYLKLMLTAVNRELADLGISRPLTPKDLDCLDSDTFLKLLSYLLTESGIYSPEQLIGKNELLLGLTEVGLPRIEYDATLDYVYWAAKRLFADGDETLTYCMLLNPKLDPKGVKRVLHFLTEFVIFTSSCSEKFEKIFDEVCEERQQRTDLIQKISNLNVIIEEKAENISRRNDVLPTLQQKSREVNAEIGLAEDDIASLEVEVMKRKQHYDEKELSKFNLEKALGDVKRETDILLGQLVRNPEFLQSSYENAKQKLEKLMRDRDEIGEELEKIVINENEQEDLFIESETVFSRLLKCVGSMEEIKELATTQFTFDSNCHKTKNEFKELQTHLTHQKATLDMTKTQAQISELEMIQKLEAFESLIANTLRQLRAQEDEKNKTDVDKGLVLRDIKQICTDITTLQDEIESTKRALKKMLDDYSAKVAYDQELEYLRLELIKGAPENVYSV